MEIDKQDSELYAAEAWADILITWLRTEHGIFYRPGMEAKHAKSEKIKPFTERMMDEGALNRLKDLHKRVTAQKEVKQECYDYLWNAVKKLSPDCDALKIDRYEDLVDRIFYEMNLVNDNCKECRRKQSTEKFSYIQRTNKAEEEVKKLKEKLDKAAADYQALNEKFQGVKESVEEKKRLFTILQNLYRDIFKKQPDGLSAEDVANKILDRMLKTEDLLHKSVDSVNKECKATGKLMVADYEKDLLKFIYKEYKDRIGLSDNTITYNPPSVRNTVLKIISNYARNRTRVDILETRIKSIFDRCKANFTVDDYVLNGDPTTSFMLDCISSWISSPAESRGKVRAEIENYKLKLKDYILKDIKEHGYRYDGLEKKSIEEIVDWIITMATCDHSYVVLSDIYTTVASPVERLRYNNCDGPTVDHMKEYILRRFEGLRINTEYCLKKMSELDGCQKELKTKIDTKDDEISRLKDLINAMNEEVGDM